MQELIDLSGGYSKYDSQQSAKALELQSIKDKNDANLIKLKEL